jgi:hemerythrin
MGDSACLAPDQPAGRARAVSCDQETILREGTMSNATEVRHDNIFVGFKPIDDLHREFQDILDALNDPAEADYGRHLLALHEHMLRHCGTEESLMLQENYPHFERHKRAHEHLLESVSNVRRRYDAGDFDAVHRFSSEMLQWFAIHASSEDRELAAFLKGSAA